MSGLHERLERAATDAIRAAKAANDFETLGRAATDALLAVLSSEQASPERVKAALDRYHECASSARPVGHHINDWMREALLAAGPVVVPDSGERPAQCEAVCYVGPGHQSRVRCDLPKGHPGTHQRSVVDYEWDEDGECVG